MITFQEFQLSNGLRVVLHEDHSKPSVVLNVIYDVGSRDENPEQTGFAHLFEHLMFGGSINIPSFDEPLQRVGGENNAFTSPDVTNYYTTVPTENIETAFWLESDRMLSLAFDQKSLDVQRSVVVEEFKQVYLNQPYGDVWLQLRPLVYKNHPYAWPTIGKEVSHIENAQMENVKAFFKKHYSPVNAILVIGGDVNLLEAKRLTEKWFGNIPSGEKYVRQLPKEEIQNEPQRLEVSGNVPMDAIYIAFKMCGRRDADYYATDLASDILGRGKSSRLYTKLINDQKIFHSVQSYVMGSFDPGMIVVEGKVHPDHTIEEAEEKLKAVIAEFIKKGITEEELLKVKNQAESTLVFSECELLNRVTNLAFAALEGNSNFVNTEVDALRAVNIKEVNKVMQQVFQWNNSSTLIYRANKKNEN